MKVGGCRSLALAAFLVWGGPVGAQKEKDARDLRTFVDSGPRGRCVDVLIVGDGYDADEIGSKGKFWNDALRPTARLLAVAPFATYRDRFNVHVLPVQSARSGCDQARDKDEFDTALDCAFESLGSQVLVVGDVARLEQLVKASGQIDLVLVLANTRRRGAGGAVLPGIAVRGRPCPAIAVAADDLDSFWLALRELGRGFAGLAYESDDAASHLRYPLPVEGDVTAANATLARCVDASTPQKLRSTLKWKHFLALPGAQGCKWLHEGAFYRSTDVFRPWETCAMRDPGKPFCPVCAEEVSKAILDACGARWNDKAWHEEHPLTDWFE